MKKILLFFVSACLFSAGTSFAQITISNNKPNSDLPINSSTPILSLIYEKPDFYNVDCEYNWLKAFSVDKYYMEGEKILLCSDIPSLFISKSDGRVDLNGKAPKLKYYTVGKYLVSYEQIDSLDKIIYASGVKNKQNVKRPEEPKAPSFITPSYKKKLAEYKEQLAEYEKLPYDLPEFVRAGKYKTISEWNKNPDHKRLVELIDEDGNSYYTDSNFGHLPVSLWNNIIVPMENKPLYVYKEELKMSLIFNPTTSSHCKSNEKYYDLFSSLLPNYTAVKPEFDDVEQLIYLNVKDNDGNINKYVLGSDNYRFSINGKTIEEPAYVLYIDNIRYTMLTEDLHSYYEKKIEKLLEVNASIREKEKVEADEQQKKHEELMAAHVKKCKEKYGDYFGELVAQGKISEGMTREMCIDSWGIPRRETKETMNGHNYEYIFFGYNQYFQGYVVLKDGKVIEFSESSSLLGL